MTERKVITVVTDDSEAPPEPAGLQEAGRRFWNQIHDSYAFDDSPEVVLLVEEAARTADVVAALQKIVDAAILDGDIRTRGSRGQFVAIPEIDALRAFRAQFLALVKSLPLPAPEDEEEDQGRGKRPMTRSESGRKAAAARWSNRG